MLDLANRIPQPPLPAGEISTGELLSDLAAHGDKRLIFAYEGRDVLPGYHVTEVKDGQFQALDCGANPEAWRETFIQLWDVPEDGRTHMPAAKFSAIMRKVSETIPFDAQAKLTFEVSDGSGAISLYRAERIDIGNDEIRVSLGCRPASCKPRDRWLVQQQLNASGRCCASS